MRGSPCKTAFHKSGLVVPVILLLLLSLPVPAEAKDPQLVPQRLTSVGDSITLGWNAETRGVNASASWVNGYYGYWQWTSGLTNVRSHNQRISAKWGKTGRTNVSNAVGGASMDSFARQAQLAVEQQAQYVTIFLGHNDVCQKQPWLIPTDEEFEAMFREGMGILSEGLPPGATVYVMAIVDIRRLYDIGKFKKVYGFVDCTTVWSKAQIPCNTMLSPSNTEADREYTRSRNMAFNSILKRVVLNYEDVDLHHHYFFTDTPFTYQFRENEISDIDCFHPSAAGQKKLAELTWNNGPFVGELRQ